MILNQMGDDPSTAFIPRLSPECLALDWSHHILPPLVSLMPPSLPSIPLLLLLLILPFVSSQNLNVTSWRKPQLIDSLSTRITNVQDAIELALSHFDTNSGLFAQSSVFTQWGTHAAFYTTLALFDRYSNQSRYHDIVLNGMRTVNGQNQFRGDPALDFIADWGLANLEAHTTYGDSDFLTFAQEIWGYINQFVSSDSGKPPSLKNQSNPIVTQCASSGNVPGGVPHLTTVAGGVFHTNNVNDLDVNMLATGTYMVLSALLFSASSTSNSTFSSSADQTATFALNHLYDSTHSLSGDNIGLQQGSTCQIGGNSLSYNSGLLIWGWSLVTSEGETTFGDILLRTVNASLAGSTGWISDDGILQNISSEFGTAFLLRGIAQVFTQNGLAQSEKATIGGFLANQYNAIRDLARSGDTYCFQWTGCIPSSFAVTDQVQALTGLVLSLLLGEPGNDSTPSGAPSPPSNTGGSNPNQPSTSHSNTGAIVGAVIAGIVGVGSAIAFVFWIRRRRRRGRDEPPTPSRRVSPLNMPPPPGVSNSSGTRSNPISTNPPTNGASSGAGGAATGEGQGVMREVGEEGAGAIAVAGPSERRAKVGEYYYHHNNSSASKPISTPPLPPSGSSGSASRTRSQRGGDSRGGRESANFNISPGTIVEFEDPPPDYRTTVGDHDQS